MLAGRHWLEPCGDGHVNAYDIDARTWQTLDQTGTSPLTGRFSSAITWTGTEVVVWGGQQDAVGNPGLRDGAVTRLQP